MNIFSLFKTAPPRATICAEVFSQEGITCIDVRGQTCPGYLLAINRETDKLAAATEVALLITYPPAVTMYTPGAKQKTTSFTALSRARGYTVFALPLKGYNSL